MARNKGMFQFAANFEIKNAAALDPRTVVATKAELYNIETWPYDGSTAYLYNGLVVSVTEENELYMLIDSVNFTTESSWKKISSPNVEDYPIVIIEDSLTSTSTEHALSANQGRMLKEMINSIPKYEIEKTTEGYRLVTESGGAPLGDIINFSDLVVKSGEVIDVDGLFVIRLTLNNDEIIDIPATALVDVYTSNDEYINITSDNKIGLNFNVLKEKLNIPTDLSEEVNTLINVVGNSTSGLVKDTSDIIIKLGNIESSLTNKVDVSSFNILESIVSENNSDLKLLEETVEETVIKLNEIDTKVNVDNVSEFVAESIAPFKVKNLIEGNNIVITETVDPGVFKIDVDNLTATNIIYENNVTVKAKLDALNDAVDSIESVVVVGITAGSGIDVDTSTSTSIPTIGIKIKEGSSITVNEDGLDIVWKEFK